MKQIFKILMMGLLVIINATQTGGFASRLSTTTANWSALVRQRMTDVQRSNMVQQGLTWLRGPRPVQPVHPMQMQKVATSQNTPRDSQIPEGRYPTEYGFNKTRFARSTKIGVPQGFSVKNVKAAQEQEIPYATTGRAIKKDGITQKSFVQIDRADQPGKVTFTGRTNPRTKNKEYWMTEE